jgi:hypothetical protein
LFFWFFHQGEREKISPVLSINLTIQRNAMRTIYPEGNMSKRLGAGVISPIHVIFFFLFLVFSRSVSLIRSTFLSGDFLISVYTSMFHLLLLVYRRKNQVHFD